ncbi:MAG: hypothetical protein WDM70_02725 [Nitrosomonadales bacterium]
MLKGIKRVITKRPSFLQLLSVVLSSGLLYLALCVPPCASGAVTAAFDFMFNCRQHPGACTPDENRADVKALREEEAVKTEVLIDDTKDFARGLGWIGW